MTTTFNDLGLAPEVLKAIAAMGYSTPTPVQIKAIPELLAGRDVLAAAQTGTGKTAAFALPIITRMLADPQKRAPRRVRALILAPTRELAAQIDENIRGYAKETSLKTALVFGGVNIKPQTEELAHGADFLVATPGRLLDHVGQQNVDLSAVEYFVLDEADRMLDMGFLPDISRILNLLPAKRQNLMFSATFSPEIKKLAKNFLKNPVLVEVARENATAETVKQVVYHVHDSEKTDVLIDILKTYGPEGTPLKQVLVFVNSKICCRRLTNTLKRVGIEAEAIHGDRTQEERLVALQDFKSGKCEVLVATDVAARGLDIAELPVVINYDVPFGAEDYVHRIGRTGRAGAKGLAIMLSTSGDTRQVTAIEELTKQKFKLEDLSPIPRHQRRHASGDREDREERDRRPRPNWRDDDHEGRVRPDIPQAQKVVYDPIFDTPYDANSAEVNDQPAAEEPVVRTPTTTKPAKKQPRVAALLGGLLRK